MNIRTKCRLFFISICVISATLLSFVICSILINITLGITGKINIITIIFCGVTTIILETISIKAGKEIAEKFITEAKISD